VALKRPKQHENFKRHNAVRNIVHIQLKAAADQAAYISSPYHCPVEGKGRALRAKPATPCPRRWKRAEADQALKTSILAGHVSEKWSGDFPRLVWYRDGDGTIYEARSEVACPNRYHAYPIDARQVPKGVKW
jgi:hypothetical protein